MSGEAAIPTSTREARSQIIALFYVLTANMPQQDKDDLACELADRFGVIADGFDGDDNEH